MHYSHRFSDSTLAALNDAGWFPGRTVTPQVERWKAALASGGLRIFPAAEEALREFGGLRAGAWRAGEESAQMPFHLDPLLAQPDRNLFAAPSHLVSRPLYPLGEVADGHAFLAITDDGRVFMFMEDLWLVGSTIHEALEALLEGKEKPLMATNLSHDP